MKNLTLILGLLLCLSGCIPNSGSFDPGTFRADPGDDDDITGDDDDSGDPGDDDDSGDPGDDDDSGDPGDDDTTGDDDDTTGDDDDTTGDPGDDIDDDGDGFTENEGDCDDSIPGFNPIATDMVGDGVDQNCDGVDGVDQDGDGFPNIATGGDDCDDSEITTYPGALDTWYDGVDSDCVGDGDYDQDQDGWDIGPDCDDTDSGVNPSEEDVPDGVDNDCDGNPDNISAFVYSVTNPTRWQINFQPGVDWANGEILFFGLHDGINFDEDCLSGGSVCHGESAGNPMFLQVGAVSQPGQTVFANAFIPQTLGSALTTPGITYVLRLQVAGFCYTWGADTTDYVADGCLEAPFLP